MKTFLFLFVLTALSFKGFSQDDKHAAKKGDISIDAEASFPVGDIGAGVKFGDYFSLGIGGYLQFASYVSDDLALTFHLGFTFISGKSFQGQKVRPTNIFPALAGIRHMFSDKFYGAAQLGMSFISSKDLFDNSKVAFTYSLGVGYKINKVDISLNYTGRSFKVEETSLKLNTLGLRAACIL